MTPPLLAVRDLHKSFGDRHAVAGIGFDVARGQTLGLIGPNGAGKSTTVNLVCGLLRADSGSIALDGRALGTTDHVARAAIGLVPQDLALLDDLPARETLRLFGALYGLRGAALKSRCDAVLELVQLADRAGERPSAYSGGMKRRLNIAAALLHAPQLLILDEPTVGVDPQSRNAILDALEALRRDGLSLIYTSHYMEEVERMADRIVIVDHGRVIADDTPAGLQRTLPAHAALTVEFAERPAEAIRAAIGEHAGVTGIAGDGAHWRVGLASIDDAVPVLATLVALGARPLHHATAKARLEDIFLTLTGRTLRDDA